MESDDTPDVTEGQPLFDLQTIKERQTEDIKKEYLLEGDSDVFYKPGESTKLHVLRNDDDEDEDGTDEEENNSPDGGWGWACVAGCALAHLIIGTDNQFHLTFSNHL